MTSYNSSLDFKAIKKHFKNNQSKNKSEVNFIMYRYGYFYSEDLIYRLENIFYRVIIVPTTDEYININITDFTTISVNKDTLNNETLMETIFYKNYYEKINLKLYKTIELNNANIECYDFDYEKYNKEILDLYYLNIKDHFNVSVLDNFRPWSKKLITKSKRQIKRENKNLPNYHNPIKLYFKEYLEEELIMNVMHPRNIGILWDFEDFY
jgi:hypothetical protein